MRRPKRKFKYRNNEYGDDRNRTIKMHHDINEKYKIPHNENNLFYFTVGHYLSLNLPTLTILTSRCLHARFQNIIIQKKVN